MSSGLGLGLVTSGLGLGLVTSGLGLGLGLVTSGLVNIPAFWYSLGYRAYISEI